MTKTQDNKNFSKSLHEQSSNPSQKQFKLKKNNEFIAKLDSNKILVSIFIAAFAVCLFFVLTKTIDNKQNVKPEPLTDINDAVKPFDGSEFEVSKLYDPPMWGSLNSGHYFGMKHTSPNSPESSLIWFENKLNNVGRLNMRHLCNQGDNLKSYGWNVHDFYNFGEQTIQDGPSTIRTRFVKNPNNSQEWLATISIESSQNLTSPYISFMQYLTINSNFDRLDMVSSKNKVPQTATDRFNLFEAQGRTEGIGNFMFNIDLVSNKKNFVFGNYHRGFYNKFELPVATYLHSKMISTRFNQTRLFVLAGGTKTPSYYDEDERDPNIVAYQLVVKSPITFTVSFTQSSFEQYKTDYNEVFENHLNSFNQKFNEKFIISGVNNIDSASLNRVAKVALSNMIGGIGYFYGESYVNSKENTNNIGRYGPIQLLTAVPSRSFFPRGFLWDEGFHNILISEWNPSISTKIIESWFNLMNKYGWIPREIILGIESIERVPREFLVQHIADGNPPTMFLAIEKMIDQDTFPDALLETIYPRLLAWFNWFETTQFGPEPLSYRWRGRDQFSVDMLNPKTLSSGLDDYPRASHPSSNEYHVDLRCWMALASRTLKKIAAKLSDKDMETKMDNLSKKLHDNKLLDALHWNESHQMYCDYGYSSEETELVYVTRTRTLQNGRQETYRKLERQSRGKLEFGCVPEFGYVNLFPLMLRIIDANNPNLGVMLDRLSNSHEVWSNYGIRSLSKSSGFYQKYNTQDDKPYWRGSIWINMNYLLLDSLAHYSRINGPFQTKSIELFNELRKNLVRNIVEQFDKSGYLWEHYDDKSGQGVGSHPFTGWTSLILMIMSNKI